MRVINPYSHGKFLFGRLKDQLRPGTYAAVAWRQIGTLIDSMFENDPDLEGRVFMSSAYAASHLSMWLHSGDWFDVEWLRSEDGHFYSDSGELFVASLPVGVAPADCLACYGLWLVEEDAHCCGPTDGHDWEKEPFNLHGWSEAQVANHKGECMLVAYQLLWEAESFARMPEPADSDAAPSTIRAVDFADLGRRGAARNKEKRDKLKEFARQLYLKGSWKSANLAAHKLWREIYEHGRTIGVPLTEQNAQRTIAEWFRKSV